jgi:hypothetical protein
VVERLEATSGGVQRNVLYAIGGVVVAVIVARFIWVFCSDIGRRGLWRMCLGRGAAPSVRVATVISWAGMRGVVSLAAALSLPEGLPGRDLVLAATFAVILVTVLVQGTTLSMLIRWLGLDSTPVDPTLVTGEVAWTRMAKAQLDAVEKASRQEDGTERHPRLLEEYQRQMRAAKNYVSDLDRYKPEAVLHFGVVLEAVRAGREEVLRMHRAGEIHDEVLRALERDLDLQEMSAEMAADHART